MENDQEPKGRENFFFLKSNNGIDVLRNWLMAREYNAFRSGKIDKKGNPMIGLSMENGKGWEKRGVIVSASPGLNELAINAVTQHMRAKGT